MSRPRMLIDCQSHLVPPFLPELIERHGGANLRGVLSDRRLAVTFSGRFTLTLALDTFTPEAALQRMDDAGIAMSVMSLNMPGAELFAPEARVEVARRCNDWLAEACRESHGCMVGLAQLPWHDPDGAQTELRRCVDELGMRGVILPSNIAGEAVDGAALESVYRAVAESGVPLVLHPAHPEWSDAILDYAMVPMVGFMTDSSIAALRLVLSGITERVADLSIVHPHCGGVIPWLMPRIEEQTERKGRGREHISSPPGALYRDLYLDLQSPSSEHIAWTVAHSRVDRLLFATDAPWVDARSMVDCFGQAEMDDTTRERAAWANAAELFGLDVDL